MKTFPSPYAVAEEVAVASEYEGGSETRGVVLESRDLRSVILVVMGFQSLTMVFCGGSTGENGSWEEG